MKIDDLIAAAIDLQNALRLFIAARRGESASRASVTRVREFAKAALDAHVAGNTLRLAQVLDDVIANAETNAEQQSNTTTRYEEIAGAVASMRQHLSSASQARRGMH
jgi:hypothetical protein